MDSKEFSEHCSVLRDLQMYELFFKEELERREKKELLQRIYVPRRLRNSGLAAIKEYERDASLNPKIVKQAISKDYGLDPSMMRKRLNTLMAIITQK